MNAKAEKLLSLPLEERIRIVAEDVVSKKDEFRDIESHELAELLGIDDSWSPGPDWSYGSYFSKEDFDSYIDNYEKDELFYLLEEEIPDERYKELLSVLEEIEEGKRNFDFYNIFTEEEQRIFKDGFEEELADNGYFGIVKASISIESPHEIDLPFEGDIEDDGACIDLRTPYDERDGNFKYSNEGDYMFDSW